MAQLNRVAILGTGLIGSSIGLTLKAARPQTQIAGYDASGENLRRAQSVKAIDRRASLRDALPDADLVIISTPVGAMKALFEEIAPLLPTHALVMDTGSTKAAVLRWANDLLPNGVRFVGSHPMAGKTETGPDAADAKLFQGAVWCLAPLPSVQRDAIDDAVRLVESLGASPYFLDPEEHDGLVASVSHLPYLMSVALIRRGRTKRTLLGGWTCISPSSSGYGMRLPRMTLGSRRRLRKRGRCTRTGWQAEPRVKRPRVRTPCQQRVRC